MPIDTPDGGHLRGLNSVNDSLEIHDSIYLILPKPNRLDKSKNHSYLNIKAKANNKLMHITNGNGVFKDLCVVQINTGNGKWISNDNLLHLSTPKYMLDIICVSESNMNLKNNIMINS